MQTTHCHRLQTAMAVLSFTLAILMIIAGVRQLVHPWDLQHHAFFNGAYLPIAIRFPFRECRAAHWSVCTGVYALLAAVCDIQADNQAWTKRSDSQLCHAGALSSTWVSAGELLSGASYILTGCLFFKHVPSNLPQSHAIGVHSCDLRRLLHGLLVLGAWARHISSCL